ncbi:MAG: cytochrome c [Verrucomicrobiales bacterium]|nr:cytochrome c [Verrucomicrobiales bacterium]
MGSAIADDELIEEAIFVLEQNCIECHNADDAKGEITLDRAPLGVNDPAMIVEVISGTDPEMPKDRDALLEEEIEILKKWVKAGAKLPKGRILEKPEE